MDCTFSVWNRLANFCCFVVELVFVARHASKLAEGILRRVVFGFKSFVAVKRVV